MGSAVDAMLRGRPSEPELRSRTTEGEIQIQTPAPRPATGRPGQAGYRRQAPLPSMPTNGDQDGLPYSPTPPRVPGSAVAPVRVYAYGVARNRLRTAAKRLGVPAQLVDHLGEADAVVTLRSYYRRRLKVIADAETRRIPVYVLRANTSGQMEGLLADLFNLHTMAEDPSLQQAMSENFRMPSRPCSMAPDPSI